MPRICLLRKRNVWVPTWQGSILILAMLATGTFLVVANIHGFLAITDRVPANILVVDSWLPDYAVGPLLAEYERGGYDHLCTTGGPLSQGSYLSQYENCAELSAATLRARGLPNARLIVAPAPAVAKLRTREAARALQCKLTSLHVTPDGMNVFAVSPHARRSRLVYARVFHEQSRVGVISCPNQTYDAERWWGSSAGLKTVVTECLSLVYDGLFD